ncbi:acyltransferase family protein [Streptomyces avicenniae]|uniref:acyltransferase family protein n=1 Tax=Streptomyces avicenniae TaxID=500153 RepID=UPI00069A44F1|nr:acyltransferase family protein [Streptomyces avicenniae]
MTALLPRRAAVRAPYWDTIRYLSGTLVLFGHLVDTLHDREGLVWLYLATWPLRVPVFALVAGWFSSAAPLTRDAARQVALTLLLPYLIVGFLHSAQQWWLTGRWWFYVDSPAWGAWFLLALPVWRLALPWLARLRRPVVWAVAAALVAGYVPWIGGWLALSRTLCFLPFFLLGWKLRQGAYAAALRPGVVWSGRAAVAVLAGAGVLAWCVRRQVDYDWLGMAQAYDSAGGPAIRAAVLLAGVVGALALLRLMPRRRIPVVSWLGAGGMYVYVLHPLVLRPLLHEGGVAWARSWPEQASVVVLACVLSAGLASAPVRRVTWWIVRPARAGAAAR